MSNLNPVVIGMPTKSKVPKVCHGCTKTFPLKDKKPVSLDCNRCKNYFCLACLNISDNLYEALTSDTSGSVLTACATCKGIVLSTQELKDQITKDIAKNQAENQISFDKINDNISKLKSEIKEELRSELTVTLTEQVHSEVQLKTEDLESRLAQQHTDLTRYIEERISENNLIQRKKRNLILYQIPESKNSALSEKITDDKQEAIKFFSEIGCDFDVSIDNIIKADRIGKPTAPDSNTIVGRKPRPLRIVVESDNLKFKILSIYRQKRRSGVEFTDKKGISQDFTPLQRKKYRDEKTAAVNRSDSRSTVPAEDTAELDSDMEVIPDTQVSNSSTSSFRP